MLHYIHSLLIVCLTCAAAFSAHAQDADMVLMPTAWPEDGISQIQLSGNNKHYMWNTEGARLKALYTRYRLQGGYTGNLPELSFASFRNAGSYLNAPAAKINAMTASMEQDMSSGLRRLPHLDSLPDWLQPIVSATYNALLSLGEFFHQQWMAATR